MIRIIIVEDQAIIRDGIKFIIEREPEIEVVGTAENGREAFELCERLHPDLALMDIVMPECDGIEGTRIIKEKYPEIKVLILTTFHDAENVSRALQNGADGYVLKDIDAEDLVLTMKGIVKGLRVMHEDPFATLFKKTLPAQERSSSPAALSYHPAGKELEIIRLIVYGKSNKEIAYELQNSEGSIRNAVSAILNKLGLADRTQLAVFAVKNNLV